ncbi:hypothetical protein PI124_g12157 [Phytophthora idaei]|nr:hypothetical protein PI125_g12622 [Phytophthora idaei]KAG3243022.1 hypothetical protein PI124_g12157 [Phytophthora idaei]
MVQHSVEDENMAHPPVSDPLMGSVHSFQMSHFWFSISAIPHNAAKCIDKYTT